MEGSVWLICNFLIMYFELVSINCILKKYCGIKHASRRDILPQILTECFQIRRQAAQITAMRYVCKHVMQLM